LKIKHRNLLYFLLVFLNLYSTAHQFQCRSQFKSSESRERFEEGDGYRIGSEGFVCWKELHSTKMVQLLWQKIYLYHSGSHSPKKENSEHAGPKSREAGEKRLKESKCTPKIFSCNTQFGF